MTDQKPDQKPDDPEVQRTETAERTETDGDQAVTERETTETSIDTDADSDESDAPLTDAVDGADAEPQA